MELSGVQFEDSENPLKFEKALDALDVFRLRHRIVVVFVMSFHRCCFDHKDNDVCIYFIYFNP